MRMKIQKNDFAKRECVSLRAASPWWVCQSRDPYLVVLAHYVSNELSGQMSPQGQASNVQCGIAADTLIESLETCPSSQWQKRGYYASVCDDDSVLIIR